MELKRVVVTGLGAITPIGNNVPEFWENLVNGVSGAGPITHFDASLFKTQFACEVKNFDATQYMDRKEARKMDLYTQYAIAVAKEAVTDSGLDVEKEDLNKIGVIFGAGIGGINTFEEEIGNYYTNKDKGPRFNPHRLRDGLHRWRDACSSAFRAADWHDPGASLRLRR